METVQRNADKWQAAEQVVAWNLTTKARLTC